MTQELRARAELPGRSRVGANGEAPPMLDPRRWLALTVVLVAGFMDLLDVTIVNLAVPTILRDLQAAYAQNFARTFSITLWYAVGILLVVLLGLLPLPGRVRARDLDAELSALADYHVRGIARE
jgi:hypothetical protein